MSLLGADSLRYIAKLFESISWHLLVQPLNHRRHGAWTHNSSAEPDLLGETWRYFFHILDVLRSEWTILIDDTMIGIPEYLEAQISLYILNLDYWIEDKGVVRLRILRAQYMQANCRWCWDPRILNFSKDYLLFRASFPPNIFYYSQKWN
jgi:hypothetical protein